jgi:hypothetical protein
VWFICTIASITHHTQNSVDYFKISRKYNGKIQLLTCPYFSGVEKAGTECLQKLINDSKGSRILVACDEFFGLSRDSNFKDSRTKVSSV